MHYSPISLTYLKGSVGSSKDHPRKTYDLLLKCSSKHIIELLIFKKILFRANFVYMQRRVRRFREKKGFGLPVTFLNIELILWRLKEDSGKYFGSQGILVIFQEICQTTDGPEAIENTQGNILRLRAREIFCPNL